MSIILTLAKEDMKFSAGHFTIFSATEREKLHGHNYTVEANIVTEMTEEGLAFDYRFYKIKLRALCNALDEFFLLPGLSPHLTFREQEEYCWVQFNQQEIPFLLSDIYVLPITNVTVEELARWFVDALIEDMAMLIQHNISVITIKISSSPGQAASFEWRRDAEDATNKASQMAAR
jgi:6-pyruvoyltetrahydropterin/6-carboxytetrahydropterin synthase